MSRARTVRPCACGCGELTKRKQAIYANSVCAARARVARRASVEQPTKVCQYAPCGATYRKPPKLDMVRWGERQFCRRKCKDAAQVLPDSRRTLRAAPGAARAGRRQEPRPVPSRDRKPEKPRPVFDGPPPAAPWRPPTPVIERPTRTVPRPSFGLTRRSA